MMRFGLYGYDEAKNEVIRITREESYINAVVNGISSRVNLFDEMKKLMNNNKSQHSVYLDKFLKKPKTGVGRLAKNIKIISPKCKGVNVFAFGWDKDMEKAENILNDILELDKQQKPENQTKLYSLAEAYLRQSRVVAEKRKVVNFMKEVFKSTENGEVFTNGKMMYAILVGYEYGGYTPDIEKMKAVPAIWQNYTKESATNVTIKVEDGVKPVREPKVPTDRSCYSDKEIYDMVNSYNIDAALLAKEEITLEELKGFMLERFPIGEHVVCSGAKKLIVKVTQAEHGRIMPDIEKMKKDSQIWKDYTKRKNDTPRLLVKCLNKKEIYNNV